MTLIASLLTNDYAIQVSDRRITPSDKFDDRNKATIFDGRLAIGYTGLADIAGKPTDIWVSDVLATAPLPDPFDYLAQAIKSEILRIPRPLAEKRMAFSAVGWRLSKEYRFEPTLNMNRPNTG